MGEPDTSKFFILVFPDRIIGTGKGEVLESLGFLFDKTQGYWYYNIYSSSLDDIRDIISRILSLGVDIYFKVNYSEAHFVMKDRGPASRFNYSDGLFLEKNGEPLEAEYMLDINLELRSAFGKYIRTTIDMTIDSLKYLEIIVRDNKEVNLLDYLKGQASRLGKPVAFSFILSQRNKTNFFCFWTPKMQKKPFQIYYVADRKYYHHINDFYKYNESMLLECIDLKRNFGNSTPYFATGIGILGKDSINGFIAFPDGHVDVLVNLSNSFRFMTGRQYVVVNDIIPTLMMEKKIEAFKSLVKIYGRYKDIVKREIIAKFYDPREIRFKPLDNGFEVEITGLYTGKNDFVVGTIFRYYEDTRTIEYTFDGINKESYRIKE